MAFQLVLIKWNANHQSILPTRYRLLAWAAGSNSFFFFSFIFISWRLITLQYCSGFCHTLTWISHGFTCIPRPDPPSHLPLYPIPLGLPSAPDALLEVILNWLAELLLLKMRLLYSFPDFTVLEATEDISQSDISSWVWGSRYALLGNVSTLITRDVRTPTSLTPLAAAEPFCDARSWCSRIWPESGHLIGMRAGGWRCWRWRVRWEECFWLWDAISFQANHEITLSIFPGKFSLMQVPQSLIGWVFMSDSLGSVYSSSAQLFNSCETGRASSTQ